MITIDNPPTLSNVARHAPSYGGMVHGNDKSGAVDVEFPTLWEGISFARTMMDAFGWEIDIRSGDSLSSIHVPVVLTIGPGYVPRQLMVKDGQIQAPENFPPR